MGEHKMYRLMKSVRKLAIKLCGPQGTTALSLTALLLATFGTASTGFWLIGASAAVIIIRLVHHLSRPRYGCLPGYDLPIRVRTTILNELKISITFVAICFFMKWPAEALAVTGFITINMILQLGVLPFSKLVVTRVTPMATNGSSPCSRRVIVVGTGVLAQQAADLIIDSPEIDTCLIGFLDYRKTGYWRYRDVPLIGHPDSLAEIVANGQLDSLFLAVEQEDIEASQELFKAAEEMGVTVVVLPSLYRGSISRASLVDVAGLPAIVYNSAPENRIAMMAKTVVDRVAALTGLLIISPLLFMVAIIVKLDSKGPVFFRQTRSGLNGKIFSLFKFRTMCNDAESKRDALKSLNEMSGPVFKIKSDPRITRTGKILRKYSIDELPQLINVLRGEMSLVGPRPALPKEVNQYEPWQRRKLSVRPGVTCVWQVSGRNEVGFEDWMRMDLQYIDNWSLWLDAKLLAKTIPTVLKGTGS